MWQIQAFFLVAAIASLSAANEEPRIDVGSRSSTNRSYDLVVYGGSPSGLAAAVQAARLGSRVLVAEPYLHIGGMMAAGLTRTDLGDAKTTGGLCREFFERMAKYYDSRGVKRERYYDFEPHVAGIIWREMTNETGRVDVLEHARLVGVDKVGASLRAIQIRMQEDKTLRIAGTVFIDATYEGDLAAMAGAPFKVGREAKSEYGEPHGLEEADKLLQAYCFRLTVTDNLDNRVSIRKPAGYDPHEFELLAKYVNAKKIKRFAPDCLFAREKTQGKSDGNAQWHCWVSTDWASFHHDYPEGSWDHRQEIYDEYKRRTLSWFYFLQHDPSVPEVLRQDALRWGLPKDEHQDTDHVPFMLYIREARRIMGDYVFTELDATKNTVKPDSIGCGGYPIDSHHVTDYHPGILHFEKPPGNFQIPVRAGYQIPYRILLPEKVEQLLVSLCVSSTHLGYCTLRMEPEYIKMGQAAGAAAHLAISHSVAPRNVNVAELQELLEQHGAITGRVRSKRTSKAIEITAAPAPERPNIIFILADDHAAHGLSCYGSAILRTPHIDRLAKEGMRFTRAVGVNSLCAPARAALLTGKYSHANGKRTNHDTFNGAQQTFPKLLQRAGYQTAIVGKWHLKVEPTGFDFYKVMRGHGSYWNPEFLETGKGWRREQGYLTDLITDSAIAWLNARDPDKPFCLMVHHKAPHGPDIHKPEHASLFESETIPTPATLHDDWRTREPLRTGKCEGTKLINCSWGQDIYRKLMASAPKQKHARTEAVYQQMIKGYMRLIASLDENVGRLLDYIDQAGLRENTVVVYTSDNGFFLGDHGMYNKMWMYEESMRLPLLIRLPGVVQAGMVNDELVSILDFAPTFLALAGTSIPDELQGRSILSLLGGQTPNGWREDLYYHFYTGYGIPEHYGLLTKDHKLMHFPGFGDGNYWELFDLTNDPDELTNIYGQKSCMAITAELHKQLTQLRHELKAE